MALFLFARDHCDGREIVRDIGDFVAHENKRDQGIVTRLAREWFITAKMLGKIHFSRGAYARLDHLRLPPVTKPYLEIAVKASKKETLRDKAGMSQKKASLVMKDIISRMHENADGSIAILGKLSDDDVKLLNCVFMNVSVNPAFTPKKLYTELIDTLKSNALISKSETEESFGNLFQMIQLFCVSKMHNAEIKIDTCTSIKLIAEQAGSELSVKASIPIDFPSCDDMVFTTSLYTSDVDALKFCDKNIINLDFWDFEIELSNDGKLTKLSDQ